MGGGHAGYLLELARSPHVTLRKVIETLKQTYCQTLGVVSQERGSCRHPVGHRV